MKRFRLATLLLVVVIVALSLALVMTTVRAARREAEFAAMGARYEVEISRITVERNRLMELLQAGKNPGAGP